MNKVLTNLIENRMVKLVICVIGSLFVCIGVLFLYDITGINYEQYAQKTQLDTGWTVSYGDKTFSDVSLERFQFDRPLKSGETVYLYHELPEIEAYVTPILYVKTHNSVIKVFMNDEEIYAYGQDKYEKNRLVGSGFHTIKLPESAFGQLLKIEVTATGDSAITKMDQIYITDFSNVYTEVITRYRLSYVISIFLIAIGIMLMLSGLIIGVVRTWFFRLIWIGMFSLFVGIWTMCNYNIIQIYAIPMNICTMIEYSVLYLGPMPILFFFSNYVTESKSDIMKKIYFTIIGLHALLTVVLFILHFIGICHIPRLMVLEHLMIGIVGMYLMTLMTVRIRQGMKASNILIIGFFFMILCVMAELVNYFMDKYMNRKFIPYTGIAALGTVIFITFLLVSFGCDIAGKLAEQREKAVLYKMAYTDNLTGVYNRRYCEERLKFYETNDIPFGIFNFDLNGLKAVNDTSGHSSGDELIKGFATILKKAFQENGVIGRMGGDEFIVIVESGGQFRYQDAIERLLGVIQEANQNEMGFVFSTAYGYADSSEIAAQQIPRDVNAVYRLADNRMYEHKKLCHDARK